MVLVALSYRTRVSESNRGKDKLKVKRLKVPETKASSGSSLVTLWHRKVKGSRNDKKANRSKITSQILFCTSSMINSIASSKTSAMYLSF